MKPRLTNGIGTGSGKNQRRGQRQGLAAKQGGAARASRISRAVAVERLEDRLLLTSVPIDQLFPNEYVPNQLIVRFEDNVTPTQRSSIISANGGTIKKVWERLDMAWIQVNGNLSQTAANLTAHPKVKYAEPNFTRQISAFPGLVPNDPLFAQQWGLHNGGQLPGGGVNPGAIDDSDIDAPEGWNIAVGSDEVIVAVIDTGIHYRHPDLVQNLWINPGEIDGDGIDNDTNGFVDDIYGIDTFNGDSDPFDDQGHGTHVSGTAAARGDNDVGVTGVSWNAKIMAVKAASAAGGLTTQSIIDAVDYVTMMKVDFGQNIVVSNHSYGGAMFSQAEEDAFRLHTDADILAACAAGNGARDNDLVPNYPSSFDLDGIIAVAATDNTDDLAGFSQWGRNSVDIAAPGVEILSTALGRGPISDPSGYVAIDGTSMATPHVAGAAAVIRSLDPSLTALEAKDIILGGVDRLPSLRRLVASEGRLNLYNSLNQMTAGFVRGNLWNDTNADGIRNQLEPGLEDWTVFLDLDSDGRHDAWETSTLTDVNGDYSLPNYRGAGNYTVSVLKEPLYNQTFPTPKTNSQTVRFATRDATVQDVNFGYRGEPGTISGIKWDDVDADGVRDTTEVGLANFTIYVDLDNDNRIDVGEPSVSTGNNGAFKLTNVPAGTVRLREVNKPGYVQTFPAGDGTHTLRVLPAQNLVNINFGNSSSIANDFGDAPEPYPTLLEDNGARHGVLAGVHLGPTFTAQGVGVDPEADGFQDATDPTITDDSDGIDDEDGVNFLTALSPGARATVEVKVSLDGNSAGKLQAWIDFNRNGRWSDLGEQIFTNLPLVEGTHRLNFTVPGSAVPGTTYARFRYGYESNLSFTGASQVGEVEDYQVNISSDQPIANNDTFPVVQDSSNNSLDVLANDIPSSSGAANLRLKSVNTVGTSGTVLTDNNGTPTDFTDDFVNYTPAPGAFGTDIFSYTVEDVLNGQTDSATVTINIERFAGNVPIALDDSFRVTVTTDLDVLANDLRGPTGVISIPANGLDSSQTAGTISLVTVNVGGQQQQRVRYVPAPGFTGTDQFLYTVRDSTGATSTATVTVHVPVDTANDLVRFRLQTTDLNGNPITQIGQGLKFQVRVYVDDTRGETGRPSLPVGLTPADQGVFSAYLDLLYEAGRVAYSGISFNDSANQGNAPNYPAGQNFGVTVPGVINESGAFQSIGSSPFGPSEKLLYAATFTANTLGTTTFKSDPADILPLHETAVNNPPEPAVDIDQIEFGTTTISVIESPDLVRIRLATTDLSGNALPNNQITAGQQFFVKAFVDDLRGIANESVYSAYLDILFNSALAQVVANAQNPTGMDITFSSTFGSGRNGNASGAGLVDEVGATQGNSVSTFTGEVELFRIRFVALDPPNGNLGTLTFIADPADVQPLHEVAIPPAISVSPAQVDYVNATPLTVVGTGITAEGEFTNPTDARDVNNDGFVSPVDALALVNFLNENGAIDFVQLLGSGGGEGEGERYYFDVNGDYVVSPLDLLGVISYLNDQANGSGGGAGEGEGAGEFGSAARMLSAGAMAFSAAPPPQAERLEDAHAAAIDSLLLDPAIWQHRQQLSSNRRSEPSAIDRDSASPAADHHAKARREQVRAAQPAGMRTATVAEEAGYESTAVEELLSDDLAAEVLSRWLAD